MAFSDWAPVITGTTGFAGALAGGYFNRMLVGVQDRQKVKVERRERSAVNAQKAAEALFGLRDLGRSPKDPVNMTPVSNETDKYKKWIATRAELIQKVDVATTAIEDPQVRQRLAEASTILKVSEQLYSVGYMEDPIRRATTTHGVDVLTAWLNGESIPLRNEDFMEALGAVKDLDQMWEDEMKERRKPQTNK